MIYCTGLTCQHWGEIPVNYNELTKVLKCPVDNSYMGKVPGNPMKDAGYREQNKVTPKVENQE